MNKNIDKLALKILENEEIIKEILNIYEFDALCDKIKSIDPRIHREDIERFVRNFEENGFEEINQENLEQVSGGKSSNIGRKITSGATALLMGISPIFVSAGTRGSQKSEKAQQKASLTQKAINFVSSHKVPCGLAFIITLALGKRKYKAYKRHKGYEKNYIGKSKEELLRLMPEKWYTYQKLCGDVPRHRGMIGTVKVVWNSEVVDAANEAVKNAVRENVYSDVTGATFNAVSEATKAAVKKVAGNEYYSLSHPKWPQKWKEAEENAYKINSESLWKSIWQPNGVAYNFVKNYDASYFVNLLAVLDEQIEILQEELRSSET